MIKKILLFVISTVIALYFVPLTASAETVAGPQTGIRNGISFMTGGVSKGERADMEEMSRDFNIKVVLAATSGSYLAKIPITIHDDKGKQVLEVEVEGPWFYARLPEGRFTIKAVYQGREKQKTVRIEPGLELVMFHWNV